MLDKTSIKIKNFKCFGEEPQVFNRIMPINVIIGKNNSGKSSLITMIEFVVQFTDVNDSDASRLLDIGSKVIVAKPLERDELSPRIFDVNQQTGSLQQFGFRNNLEYGETLLGKYASYSMGNDTKIDKVYPPELILEEFRHLLNFSEQNVVSGKY